MKFTTYTFNFKGGQITVKALNENQARILAQAEAINRCWDYEIIGHPIDKGETEYQTQIGKAMVEKMMAYYEKTEKGGVE